MNYARIYRELIQAARDNPPIGYSEKHHIVPRCQGGLNCADNLVRLSPRYHFVAHQLLVKMNPGFQPLVYAAFLMSNHGSIGAIASREYAWLRKKHSAAVSLRLTGVARPAHVIAAMASAMRGKKKSEEHRATLSVANSGKTLSAEVRAKISVANKGRVKSQEERARISAAKIGLPNLAALGNKSRTGMKNSPEMIKASASARRGKKHGAERCRNISVGLSKISDEVVISIRSDYHVKKLSQDKIARKLGLPQSTVSRIVRGVTYGWAGNG